MPYSSISELPKQIQDALPEQAQRQWMRVFNSVSDDGDSELSAMRQAWGAVKQGYEKRNGEWVAKIEKAEYQGREVELNKPFRTPGESKKFAVYVQDGDTVKIVRFGDPDMEIRRDDPDARRNFRARHSCDTATDKTSARYWSCKLWGGRSVSDILKNRFEGQAPGLCGHGLRLGVRLKKAGSGGSVEESWSEGLDLPVVLGFCGNDGNEYQARYVRNPDLHIVAKNEGSVFKSEPYALQQVWRRGPQDLPGMDGIQGVSKRHGGEAEWVLLGSDRQQLGVFPFKLPVDTASRSAQESQVCEKEIHPTDDGLTVKVEKVDDGLGLVFGWAIVSEVNGEPYIDSQDDYIPSDVAMKAIAKYMEGERVAKTMHVGERTGTVTMAYPMEPSIMKSLGIQSDKTGVIIAMKPDTPAQLAKFADGTYSGFSIGGSAAKEAFAVA